MATMKLAFDRSSRRIDADGRLHVDRSHKVCSKCGESKSVDLFNRRAKSLDGLQHKCKACAASEKKRWVEENVEHVKAYAKTHGAIWRDKNRERIAEVKRKYHWDNAARLIAKAAAWQRANKPRVNEKNAIWRKANPGVCNAKSARRRALKFKATPNWADVDAIRKIYDTSPLGYDVDHIVPLNSPLVCGLHVANNLQVIPESANREKGNKFWPDMP